MINIHLPQNNPLELLKSKTGYAEFIQNFAGRLLIEPEAISRSIQEMEKSLVHPAKSRAEEWGRVYDGVARAIGLEIEPDVMNAKLDLQNSGINLTGPTLEVIDNLDMPAPEVDSQSSNVFDIDEIRARISELHVPTVEQLLAESPVGLKEVA